MDQTRAPIGHSCHYGGRVFVCGRERCEDDGPRNWPLTCITDSRILERTVEHFGPSRAEPEWNEMEVIGAARRRVN